jgi:hypothetical protein
VLPIAPKALGFTASSRAAGGLAALVLLVAALVACVPGIGVLGSSSASAQAELATPNNLYDTHVTLWALRNLVGSTLGP